MMATAIRRFISMLHNLVVSGKRWHACLRNETKVTAWTFCLFPDVLVSHRD